MPPKFTAVAPVNPDPVIVTLVPPDTGPLLGLTPVTAAAAPCENSSCVTSACALAPVALPSPNCTAFSAPPVAEKGPLNAKCPSMSSV